MVCCSWRTKMQRYLLNIAYIGTQYKWVGFIYRLYRTEHIFLTDNVLICSGVTKNVMMKNHNSIEDVLHQAIKKIRSVDKVEIFPSSRYQNLIQKFTFDIIRINLIAFWKDWCRRPCNQFNDSHRLESTATAKCDNKEIECHFSGVERTNANFENYTG